MSNGFDNLILEIDIALQNLSNKQKLIFVCRRNVNFRQILRSYILERSMRTVIKNALSLSWKDRELGNIKNSFVNNFCTLLPLWMLNSYL